MDRGARVGGWGGEQCTMCRPGLFTVERLSLGLVSFSVLLVFFFLWGLFSSVYGERRGTTLPERKASFPKPQTSRVGGGGGGGDALSPIYVFHPAPCKHPA